MPGMRLVKTCRHSGSALSALKYSIGKGCTNNQRVLRGEVVGVGDVFAVVFFVVVVVVVDLARPGVISMRFE